MMGRERGVALAIVLWFVAGMTLLVAGIVSHARVDTRSSQVHLARAKSVAAGDGAIRLAMIERLASREAGGPPVTETVHRLGELDVRVRIYPAAGFVDLNEAPGDVLAALFRDGAGMTGGDATTVANNVVNWRENRGVASGGRGQRQRFHSLEDALRVDGVTRTLLDAIRDYAVAGDWAPGGTNWSAASQEMLQVLGPDDADDPSALDKPREGGEARGRGLSAGGVYRADALIQYGGRTWLRRRWLREGDGAYSSLPWQVVRTETPRVVQG